MQPCAALLLRSRDSFRRMSSAASAIDAPPLLPEPLADLPSGLRRRLPARCGRSGRRRGSVSPSRWYSPSPRSCGRLAGRELGVLEAHGGERELDDRGPRGSAAMRSAGMPLANRKRRSVVVGLARRGPGRSTREACRRAWRARRGARPRELLLGPLLGGGDVGLAAARRPRPAGSPPPGAAASGAATSAGSFSASVFQSMPATTGRQRPAGRPGRSAATRSPPARRWRLAALGHAHRLLARLRRPRGSSRRQSRCAAARTWQHGAQLSGTSLQARLVLVAPEIRGSRSAALRVSFGGQALLARSCGLECPPKLLAQAASGEVGSASLLFRRHRRLGVRHQAQRRRAGRRRCRQCRCQFRRP